MVNSIATLTRRLSRSLLSNPKFSQISMPFCSDNLSSIEDSALEDSNPNSDTDTMPSSISQSSFSSSTAAAASPGSTEERVVYDRKLENGLDLGIYRAILVGQVGQIPLQKKLKSGRIVTLFSLGTGGIRNNRRPLQNEEPREFANRSNVQWHRVSVYPLRLGALVMKNILPGSIIYLEGNLETKMFNDPITGLVRRVREVAIRRDVPVFFRMASFDVFFIFNTPRQFGIEVGLCFWEKVVMTSKKVQKN
ncbi:single-stranded DNA-binding protein, mitochondrial isoform X1 [Hevea brasiliensis]|uniref:single-stranded DNA-binding protein, mitochondrial isoform X1 n=1 Tax=Hevea brasiliensis TaxID=3981 RepID=UPI0025FC49BA|nr:single-stranded DNA-binding protein, mitochondrial isoform X1 [Hevea brasiliensis]XP_058009924.1 single-stranded DNA-binding protein, mitochondrial isoform X1 [Hevea brasiliensis]